MADLIIHMAIGHCIKRMSSRPDHPILFALGSCLPDLVGRAPGLLTAAIDDQFGLTLSPYFGFGIDALHTPLPYVFLCLFLSYWVTASFRKVFFWNLTLGGWLHILVDLPQEHIAGGYRLLFPFSWETFELGWAGTESSLYLIGPLVLAALVTEVWYRRRSGRAGNQPGAEERN